ncbi:biotin/methionine sulfoxide reductase [Pacificibacter maritimus]|uniref:Biotin/methionine sulfoxide reductase n=1 Tax=Pacificibacter maritimus TaxID=762213 RepID=A0A3N4UBI0_9RHOB|nr:molybdopterin-dependent oxidoreductase [Pacificibacter maritimus]RPE67158.1 biotin/methionine sulfoxide reductase [Pacificibacter maritimus]
MVKKYTASHWGAYEIQGADKDLTLAPFATDPDPARIGRGWLDAMQDTETRIARPSIRKGWLENRDHARSGNAEFVQVPWDEALNLLAQEVTRVRTDHGNKAIFAGSYGWASAGRFHHAQSQLRRFLNLIGGYTGARDTYSHAGAEVILPHLTGMTNRVFQDQMTSWPLVAEHCETLVSFGGLSKRPAQVASSGTSKHETQMWLDKAQNNGCRIINISPLKSDVAPHLLADWIAPRPGTDTALILALAYELFDKGYADRAFLERYTNGSDQFEAYVTGVSDGQPKTADWAADICDIPAQIIKDLAQRMGTTKTMINMAWSLQRADHGEVTVWAGLALAAILGQIGQAGTGFAFGYGSTETVGRPRKLINWPSMPQGMNPIASFIPVARIADMLENPNQSFSYNGRSYTYPEAKMIWWSGGNPFHHHQDLARLDRLWQRPDTVVVMDHSWTATARRADIVLPTTSALERDDLMINRRDETMVYMSAAMPVMGAARDDFDILADLSKRFDVFDSFTEGRTAQEWQQQIWISCQKVANRHGFELPEFDLFKSSGVFEVPNAEDLRIQFSDFIADPVKNALKTHSGKIELHSQSIADMGLADCPDIPRWMPPVESLIGADDDLLHLISGQPDTRLHSQNDNGSESRASKLQGREVCVLHPDAAKQRGLSAGDIVLIENARGGCLAGLALSDSLRRDCIALPTGAWLDLRQIDGKPICVHGNPNMLTRDKGSTQLSQGNIAHTAVVRVSKWSKPLPEISIFDAPNLTSTGAKD